MGTVVALLRLEAPWTRNLPPPPSNASLLRA
jgi:hypothetical protein